MRGSRSKSTGIDGSDITSLNSSSNNNNSCSNEELNPTSISARLSVGMIPYFIPPQPQSTLGQQASREVGNVDPALDASLMTPPMSPTESSFGFHSNSTIEGRFASPSSQHSYLSSPNDWRSFKTDSVVSPTKGSMSSPVSLGSGSGSTLGSTGLSPRAVSFNWDRYEDFHEDQDDRDSQDESDNDHEGNSMTAKTPYYKQFEGHHSIVRRRSSYGGEDEGHYRHELGQPTEEPYDSLRHGIGLSLSDMNEELEKARAQMSRASRAMRNMEHELQVMQQSIDESKASNASARSAIEENFWRLECLARTIEKDRQESQKRIQAVGRDCNEAIETVTNWEVRIDWLEKRVDNTSEYVSELVLSEQECMSFIKMIIQQNRRYAMPAISKATERNIRLMAPPRLREISNVAYQPNGPALPRQTPLAQPQPQPQRQPKPPLQPQPSVRHIPISWLLDPIMPPKPPEISPATDKASNQTSEEKKPFIEPPAEVWRDFSRLTTAFETGQTRTPFSPFQRTRSRSTGQGTLLSTSGFGLHTSGSSNSNSSSNSSNSLFKANVPRRPQVENLTPLPKILPPVVAPTKLPMVKRRGQSLSHLPVHSWLQFQFNKTMTTPASGSLAPPGTKKTTGVLGFKPITIFQTTV